MGQICWPTRPHVRPETRAIATGWGRIKEGGRYQSNILQVIKTLLKCIFKLTVCLQFVKVLVHDIELCRHWIGRHDVLDSMFCAGADDGKGGKDTCQVI